MIESHSMRCSGHVARVSEDEGGNSVLRETLQERSRFEYLGVDRRTILKWIFKKMGSEVVDWPRLAHDR
jgi:hypothetical protein